jgi:hypothetical protein
MSIEQHDIDSRPPSGDRYDYSAWTDEWRDAVRGYLDKGISHERVYTAFILEHLPAPGGASSHFAAVTMAPTLDQLIDAIERPSPGYGREDAGLWLTTHGVTDLQLVRMARDSGHPELLEIRKTSGWRNLTAYDLVEVLALSQLRAAWDGVKLEPYAATNVFPQARAWGHAHGYKVGSRGSLSAELLAEYEAAQSKS